MKVLTPSAGMHVPCLTLGSTSCVATLARMPQEREASRLQTAIEATLLFILQLVAASVVSPGQLTLSRSSKSFLHLYCSGVSKVIALDA